MTKRTDRPEDTCCEGCFGMTWIPELDRRFILCNNPRSDHYGHVLDSHHSCQEFGYEAPEDEEFFRPGELDLSGDLSVFERVGKAHALAQRFRGKINNRAVNTIARLIAFCHEKHILIGTMTDRDMLDRRSVGPQTLGEIRKVIPRPEGDNGKRHHKIPASRLG